MFKFNISDQVKVKPYGGLVIGNIILRTLNEDKDHKVITYEVEFYLGVGCGNSTVIVSEKHLQELQLEGYTYE